MKLLIVTNRRINNESATNEDLFGEKVNVKGASELRLAWAEMNADKSWKLELIPESTSLVEDDLPSKSAFKAYMELLCRTNRDCVFYVHGFNKDFLETLEQSQNIHESYDVGVVTFSWPSNPGGTFWGGEYTKAQAIASNSIAAMDRTFEKLALYLHASADEDCVVSMNLLLHSLGNFMFERFVRDPIFTGETRIFDNIVLNAADVDLKRHSQWTNSSRYARRIHATINERDAILDLSDIINPDRLGNTAKRLNSTKVTYFDLTDGHNVNKRHQHFSKTAKKNAVVREFFNRAFHGKQALPIDGTQFDPNKNAYTLTD